MSDPSWLSYLKEWPGLLLSAAVIIALIKIILKLIENNSKMLEGATEQRVVLSEVVSLLRTLCARGDGKGKG